MVNVIEKDVLLHYLVNPRLTRGGGVSKVKSYILKRRESFFLFFLLC